MERSLVLIVDDDEVLSEYVAELVSSVGLEALTFSNADEFLATPLPEVPCCMILDVRMPGLSGPALHSLMIERGIGIPVIFITAHGNVELGVESIKKGAFHFIQKPFDNQELIDTVQEALRKSKRDRQKKTKKAMIKTCFDSLTRREQEVFFLVSDGLPNKTIASELGISEKTVKIHRGHMMHKMDATSLADLVKMAELIKAVEPVSGT